MRCVNNLTFEEFEQRLTEVPEVEPDEWDRKMLADIDTETDDATTPIEAIRAYRKCSGKISLRVPKELHYKLLEKVRDNKEGDWNDFQS